MARYKHIDTSPRFLPVDLARQLLPGTFEHALNHLLDHEIDLSHFDRRFRNAAKSRSGTRTDFERQAAKLEAAAKTMLQRHREEDAKPVEPDLAAKEGKLIERLKRDAAQLRGWLAAHPEERRGVKGAMRKSNRTDNESAKMATGKGVIQGYTGVAAVDGKHQVIVEAQAHGTGSEQELLVPVVGGDEGALIADNGMRGRDERFATQGQHRQAPDPLHDKSNTEKKAKTYRPTDFTYDPAAQTCVCPAGKSLYRHGSGVINGYAVVRFQGAQRDCLACSHRNRCLRTPDKTRTRQVAFFNGKAATTPESHTDRMKKRIDSPEGRARYGERLATVEPVFANLRYNKRLDRFTLRGQAKVDAQWKLFCLVHNIEKLAHHGYAQ